MTRLFLGGHRGMGCTDHDFYQSVRDIKSLPVENTIDSIVAAFQAGADYIETDAVMSEDGIIFTLHNVVPKDHFFGKEKPADVLNKLPFAEIEKYKTGRLEKGGIAPFKDMLDTVARHDPQTLPWAINIEIKGVQGSGQPFEENDYLANLADTVRQSSLDPKRILWSSFSLENIIRMSGEFPRSSFGMLFAERADSWPIYSDRTDDPRFRYLPFDANHVDLVQAKWNEYANPKAQLGYVHPEVMTIDKAKIEAMKERGLGINCWALFEEMSAARLNLYRDLVRETAQKGVAFTVITDYLPEMKKLGL